MGVMGSCESEEAWEGEKWRGAWGCSEMGFFGGGRQGRGFFGRRQEEAQKIARRVCVWGKKKKKYGGGETVGKVREDGRE